MTTALFTHPASLEHVTPEGHPERVDRILAIERALSAPEFDALDRRSAPPAARAALLRCHPPEYVDRVASAAPEEGWVALDGDTHVMSGSYDAGLRAAGGAIAAVDAVLDKDATNAFCALRPPGHHAERATAMGFCLFGAVAIAAKHALEARGLSRVAVVDFDVHHGNGTQDLLWEEARATFISTHQSPLYPGTGMRKERGAHGQILNLPLPPGTDGTAYRPVFETRVLPALRQARPELILVSAGFDAHAADPLAQMALGTEDFAWIAERLCDVAGDICAGRLVSVLEGGYDLTALAESVAAYVAVMMARGQERQGND
ncbi:histone deacetylase family protein [Meridianimarinicoccus sp. MJW13]|uniref:histone deacetylase family protein n=1 Tax=Meridianimarinicoccus sp. MJW13 TaxID=2720031 RepID=UPI0018679B48|nr:histone deacetylase family protein [Fluviibacterium sp. MJW13]